MALVFELALTGEGQGPDFRTPPAGPMYCPQSQVGLQPPTRPGTQGSGPSGSNVLPALVQAVGQASALSPTPKAASVPL